MSNVYTLQTNNDIETDKKNNFYYFVIEIWQLKRWHKINLYSCLIECGFKKFSTTFKTILSLLLLFKVQKE